MVDSMNDPVVQQLRQALAVHGASLLQDRARLEQELAPVGAAFPGKVKALRIVLEREAVAFLIGWAKDARAGKASFEQVRQHVAAKFAQANLLDAAAAAWAVDAWAAALGVRPVSAPRTVDAATGAAPAPAPSTPASVAAPSSHNGERAVAPPNLYAPPAAHVEDPSQANEDSFIEGGRAVAAGAGWRWMVEGFNLFWRNPLIWIVNVLLFLFIVAAVQIVPVLGGIAGSLLAAILAGGLMLGAHAVYYGDALEVGHLFAGFRDRAGTLVLVGLIYLVSVVVVVVGLVMVMGVGLGFAGVVGAGAGSMGIGVILAGLIALALLLPLGMAYWFAPALVSINGIGAVAAMKASFLGCLRNILPFLVYGLVVVVAAILATLPLGLGWFVLAPVLFASMYAGYRDIYYAD